MQQVDIQDGKPTVLIQFNGMTDILFGSKFFGVPSESQLEIAGQELICIAKLMREQRLGAQLTVKKA